MSSRRNRHRRESEAHKILKQEVFNLLREQGFVVFKEYRVNVEGCLFIVDVVGFKDKESVAIECGRTSYEKIIKLKKVFSEVKRFLYHRWLHPKSKFTLKQRTISKISSRNLVPGEVAGISKVSIRGRVQIPKEIREELGLEDGDAAYWVRGLDGRIYVMKATEIV